MKYFLLVITLICTLMLAACSQQKSGEQNKETIDQPVESSPVLATVNGEQITQADVNFMISRTFSGAEQMLMDESLQAKVLDSLIASSAMRQKMLAELPEDTLLDIENRTKAFREELLVKEYLVQHATPQPVSSKMVQEYYTQYPEEFGGGETRSFEMLAVAQKPDEATRDKILSLATTLKNNSDWAAFAASNTVGLSYKKAQMQPGLFEPALENAIKGTAQGQVSEVAIVNGKPHIVRVLSVEKLPAKPLAEVSGDIRKKLAALQLKKAVKAASETATSEATVVKK